MNWRGSLRGAPPPLSAAPAFLARPTAPVGRASRRAVSTAEFAWAGRIGRSVRQLLTRHRRLAATICAALAALVAVSTSAGQHSAGVSVITAARDLASGTTLTAADVTATTLPARAVPAGAITSAAAAVGRPVAGAIRRGEPLTDARLDRGVLASPAPGLVAAPVRLADAQATALLQPGERVDVLAAATASQNMPAAQSEADILAAGVQVLSIPPPPGGVSNAAGTDFAGALIVLATTPAQARVLAQAQVSARLSAVVVG